MQEECCGNFECDSEDEGCSDCDLVTLGTSTCNGSDCENPTAVMFDLSSSQDISIKSVNIQLYDGTNNIVVYVASSNYSNVATDPSQWTRLYTNTFAQLGKTSDCM